MTESLCVRDMHVFFLDSFYDTLTRDLTTSSTLRTVPVVAPETGQPCFLVDLFSAWIREDNPEGHSTATYELSATAL